MENLSTFILLFISVKTSKLVHIPTERPIFLLIYTTMLGYTWKLNLVKDSFLDVVSYQYCGKGTLQHIISYSATRPMPEVRSQSFYSIVFQEIYANLENIPSK